MVATFPLHCPTAPLPDPTRPDPTPPHPTAPRPTLPDPTPSRPTPPRPTLPYPTLLPFLPHPFPRLVPPSPTPLTEQSCLQVSVANPCGASYQPHHGQRFRGAVPRAGPQRQRPPRRAGPRRQRGCEGDSISGRLQSRFTITRWGGLFCPSGLLIYGAACKQDVWGVCSVQRFLLIYGAAYGKSVGREGDCSRPKKRGADLWCMRASASRQEWLWCMRASASKQEWLERALATKESMFANFAGMHMNVG